MIIQTSETMRSIGLGVLIVLTWIYASLGSPIVARGQSTLGSGFTFQGRLEESGDPADGIFDFEFKLYDTSQPGTGTQVGATATKENVAVRVGVFSVELDFGDDAFGDQARWLEIGVRAGASSSFFTPLSPRQAITPAPQALSSSSTSALQGNPVSELEPLIGQVLKWDGAQWTPAADTAGGGASPLIDSLTDATGGLLVVGDIVDINGSNLDTVDAAFVGDLPAPILLPRSASQMRIQIPQGVRNGINSVRLVDLDGDTGFSASAAVRVHRLAIFIGQARGRIVIVDTTDNSIVTTISQTISSANWPYCVAFANNGSLAFVPTGTGVNIFIDMTADPPTSGSVRDGSQIMGYAVSPDNLLVAAADRSGGAIRTLEILEFEPPYADPVTIGRSLTGFSRPRCPVFLNNEFLAVALEGRDEIAVLERGSDRFTDLDFIRYDTGLDRPSQLRLDPRRATLFAFGLGGRLASFRVSEESLGLVGSLSTFGAIAFDLSPSGDFAYVADDSLNLIMPVWIGAGSLSRIASPRIRFEESGDPSGFIINTIAVDPVEGAYAYLGLDDGDFVDVFDIINGATFVRRTESRLGGESDLDNCRGIGIQP